MQGAEIRPGRSLANYWDVVVNNWAIAWIRLETRESKKIYWIKITGKIQGDHDPLEMQPFDSIEVAAQESVNLFRERFNL